MSAINYGPETQNCICAHCGAKVTTSTTLRSTTKTYFMAFLMCVYCCWCCSWLPFCTNSCRNVDHYCPACKTYLGTYES